MSFFEKFQIKLMQEGVGSAVLATFRWLARRLGVSYNLQPYEYVQQLVERRLHVFLGCQSGQISRFLIVGAYLGHEVGLLRVDATLTLISCYLKRVLGTLRLYATVSGTMREFTFSTVRCPK
jgi:hypothetical protein